MLAKVCLVSVVRTVVVTVILGSASAARASTTGGQAGAQTAVDDPSPRPAVTRPTARDVAGSGHFLTGVEPAKALPLTAVGLGVAGFDGARHTAYFAATAEMSLNSWLVLHAGVIYRPNTTDDRAAARPAVALRAGILEQARAGFDLALSAGYSQERLAAEGGILRIGAAVGRSFGRLSFLGNAAVGGDPEGDDRTGTVSGVVFYQTTSSLHLGAQGSFRRDLGSTDRQRLLRNDWQREFAIGPVASYARDILVFTLQTGVAGVKGATSAVGVLALGGVGAVF